MATDEDLQKKLRALTLNKQRIWAEKHKYDRTTINKVATGKRKMTKKIAAILGYELNISRTNKWRKIRKPK